MKHTFKYISFAGILSFLLVLGCTDKFLETEIPGRLATEDFYKTDADALQATTAIYDMMQAQFCWGWNSPYMLKTLPSDESNAMGGGPGDLPEYHAIDDMNFDSQNELVLGSWRYFYYIIGRANQVINKITPETELRVRLIAEAKAIRAYHYFELVSLWGDVPIVLDDLPPSSWSTQTRAPKTEVYAQIEKDLAEAIPALPEKSAYGQDDAFRVARGTARAILLKAYLFQEKWTAAIEQFEAIEASGEYELDPVFSHIFSKGAAFGPESFLEIANTSQVGYDWGSYPWDRTGESNIYTELMGPKSDYYTMAPDDSLLPGWGFNTPTRKMWDAFVDAGDTVRRAATVMSEQELEAKGGDWSVDSDHDYEGFFRRKFGSFRSETNESNGAVADMNYGTNWYLIRYGDVILMAAEAYYRSGDETNALANLNRIRSRAKMPGISGSGNAIFDAIVKERELELAFEGFRYEDLIRWGLAAQELSSRGFVTGKHEVFPIPNDDVRIAGLTQNPGY
jgi:hypothetical protein